MKDGALLANAGHFDVELDLGELRALATGGVAPGAPAGGAVRAGRRAAAEPARPRPRRQPRRRRGPSGRGDGRLVRAAGAERRGSSSRTRGELAAGRAPGARPRSTARSGGSSWPRSGSRSTSRPPSSRTTASPGPEATSPRRRLKPDERSATNARRHRPRRDEDRGDRRRVRNQGARLRRGSPTPTDGGPPDVAARDGRGDRGGVRGRGREAVASWTGSGVGSPGLVDRRPARWPTPATCRTGGTASRSAQTLSNALGTKVFVGNDVQVATEAEFELGAGKPYESLLGVFWGTGVGGGMILDGKAWLGRGGAGEIGHMVVKHGRRAHARAGGAAAWRPTPAARRWRPARASASVEKGAKTDLFKLMEKHGRTRLTSSIWARALEQGDTLATELIDRGGRGARRRRSRRRSTCSTSRRSMIGGGLGVRFGAAVRPSGSRRRCSRTCSTTSVRPPCTSPALGDLGRRDRRRAARRTLTRLLEHRPWALAG